MEQNKLSNILCVVGNSPLIKIDKVFAKLETTNPTGSVKDRMVCFMLEQAETRGELKPGSEIIEMTSGNTGIALAMASALKGYKFTAIMPESMSIERRRMIQAFGANIILTPAEEDMAGAMKKYQEVVSQNKNAWLPRQFENLDNIEAHRRGIGQEIIKQMNGKIDVFIAGAGTGGTLIGVAKALKEINPKVKIIVVEPAESAVLSGGQPGLHKIQGIGEGFVPKILKDNLNLVDEVVAIKSQDAINKMNELACENGILVGISSGANILAAMKFTNDYENVVTVLPDRGERYLSK